MQQVRPVTDLLPIGDILSRTGAHQPGCKGPLNALIGSYAIRINVRVVSPVSHIPAVFTRNIAELPMMDERSSVVPGTKRVDLADDVELN